MFLKFNCPSCGTKLRGVEAMDAATSVVTRTCPNKECRETWQLVVSCLKNVEGLRMDKASFAFKGRK